MNALKISPAALKVSVGLMKWDNGAWHKKLLLQGEQKQGKKAPELIVLGIKDQHYRVLERGKEPFPPHMADGWEATQVTEAMAKADQWRASGGATRLGLKTAPPSAEDPVTQSNEEERRNANEITDDDMEREEVEKWLAVEEEDEERDEEVEAWLEVQSKSSQSTGNWSTGYVRPEVLAPQLKEQEDKKAPIFTHRCLICK